MTRNTFLALVAVALSVSGLGMAGAQAAKRDYQRATPAAPAEQEVRTDTYVFSYSYPAAAGAIPGLKAALEADRAKQKARLARSAAEGRRMAQKGGYGFSAYDYGKGWDVVTDLPGWLSLSAAYSGYEGGAHGYTGFDTLLWDKRAGTKRAPLDLFRSKRAFNDAVRAPFCAALDKERAERRDGEESELFGDCIDATDTVIILGSSNGRAFNRIGFLIAPYLAGPYVEGSYEVTLPVSPALLAAVKPQYRAIFAVMN
jgi:hypothetical protein